MTHQALDFDCLATITKCHALCKTVGFSSSTFCITTYYYFFIIERQAACSCDSYADKTIFDPPLMSSPSSDTDSPRNLNGSEKPINNSSSNSNIPNVQPTCKKETLSEHNRPEKCNGDFHTPDDRNVCITLCESMNFTSNVSCHINNPDLYEKPFSCSCDLFNPNSAIENVELPNEFANGSESPITSTDINVGESEFESSTDMTSGSDDLIPGSPGGSNTQSGLKKLFDIHRSRFLLQ